MDIVDLSAYKYWNDNNRYLLMVIDCWSKIANIFVLKNKGAAGIAKSMDELFALQKPEILQMDNSKQYA